MRACRIDIKNFRGIWKSTILLPKHGVLIGDNNTGKTTILEALDLALGPDRLNRNPPIDEHDFFRGIYRAGSAGTLPNGEAGNGVDAPAAQGPTSSHEKDETPRVEIEVAVANLTEEQQAKFGDYIEFWDSTTDTFYNQPDPTGVDPANITEALRVTFHGWYEEEEDDFQGKTFFTRSLTEGDSPQQFSRRDKQVCGFLYLRSLRTGSRALSLGNPPEKQR